MRSHVSLRQLSGRALLMVLCAQAAAPTLAAEPVNRRPAATTGKSATPAASREQFVDGIAAIVDKDVITLRELDVAMRNATQDLQAQKIQVPPQEVLQRQVLEQIIMQRVQKHEAERMNIRVEDAQIDQAIQTIAQRNRLTSAQMQAEVQKSGVSWADYRRQLGDEIRLDRMRQRAVDSSIVISDAEVDAYLKEQARRGGAPAGFGQPGARTQAPTAPAAAAAQTQPTVLALGQILLRVPEGADSSSVASLRKKAEDILAQLRSGTDFASAAAANSDGPEALEGGNMGARPVEGWPELFLKAVADLQPGQPSDIVQSGNGFHILMVLGLQGGGSAPAPAQAPAPAAPAQAAAPQGPMNVTQTRARHILIKTSTVMSDGQARQRLEQLRQRIVQGNEPFADLARQNSQDATAPQGGDLGWLNPGETVPPFEQAMNALQPNEISQPVQSPFGWHLIQVQERREQDVADEYQRMQARQTLFERRAQPAMEDWLQQLRDRAYVDNRLEKLERLQSTNQ